MILDHFIIGQILGFFCLLICVLRLQAKSPRIILLCEIPNSILCTLSCLFLGGITGAVTNAAGLPRCLGLIFLKRKYHLPLVIGLILLVWAIAFPSIKTPIDVFPSICCVLGGLAFYMHEKRSVMVRFMLMNSILWLVYNCYIENWFLMLASILAITSNLIGMARHEGWFRTPILSEAAE